MFNKTFKQKLISLFVLCLLCLSPASHAALTIEIVGGGATQIPVAIVPFAGDENIRQSITSVIAADLQRSGLFKLVDATGVVPIPREPADVRYPDWKSRGADAIAIGTIVPQSNGQIEVHFRLMDVVKQTQLAGFSYTITASQSRVLAHRISDVIYEKLTGDVGVFSTKITYVIKHGNYHELQLADADGANSQTIITSREPIISPAWSPDGNHIAYVSFESRKPVVAVKTLSTGQHRVVANFKGSNSAPAWSPDGSRIAVVLTKDGTSQIYSISPSGSDLRRLSNSGGIDTEPSYSPDGQWIIFTSDRGGSPQIYRMPANGGNAERMTFSGTYNVSPHFSPDGKSFVFIQREGGQFNVALEDIASRQVQLLTDTGHSESPSFAPNGKIILYASLINSHGILAAVSSDGRVKQRLTVQSGDVREPAWGPLSKTQFQ